MKKESSFQHTLIQDIKSIFPHAIVLKNDPNYLQGFPDLLVLNNDKWAALECKREGKAHRQPNQEYYIEKLNGMSYARFVCPENKKEVLNELQQAL